MFAQQLRKLSTTQIHHEWKYRKKFFGGVTFYRAACNADAVLWREFCQSVRLSVRLFVCLSDTWFVTKWKKDRSRFLYHTKEHLS